MTYFLDFDRTVFDYDSYLAYFTDIPAFAPFKERILSLSGKNDDVSTQKRREMFEELDIWYEKGGYKFTPGELQRFMFPDAFDFLRAHGKDSVIITSGGTSTLFQEDKIKSAGAAEMVAEVRYLHGRNLLKGSEILALCGRYKEPFVFIDDLVEQLDHVAAAVPKISLFEIRRDGKAGSGKYPVIRLLNELPI